jgi:hypothetical protein
VALSLAFCAFCVWQSVEAIAGEMTFFSADANVGLSAAFPVELKASVNWAVWVGLICSVLINLFQWLMLRAQKGHNQDTIRHFAGTKQRLEAVIDPARTSSGLAEDGRTHPRDQ